MISAYGLYPHSDFPASQKKPALPEAEISTDAVAGIGMLPFLASLFRPKWETEMCER